MTSEQSKNFNMAGLVLLFPLGCYHKLNILKEIPFKQVHFAKNFFKISNITPYYSFAILFKQQSTI